MKFETAVVESFVGREAGLEAEVISPVELNVRGQSQQNKTQFIRVSFCLKPK